MAKPYVITIRVEEIALGATLRKLHEMPGVMSVDMDLGEKGGTGPGAQQLAEASAKLSRPNTERVAELFIQVGEPLHIRDVAQRLGIKQSTTSTVVYGLKKNGIVEQVRVGVWQATAAFRTRAQQQGAPQQPLALPAPAAPLVAAHGPKGRAKDAQAILIDVLSAAPVLRNDLAAKLAARGLQPKSTSGVVQRALAAKVIKRSGVGSSKIVELTDKGRKQLSSDMNGAVAHHG